ncbi:hypothetical protein CKO09_11070 [Chromatium weissei]|nr:hypothetical protein [Chromatium weissei]
MILHEKWLQIALDTQTLTLFHGERELTRYAVSTARNGAGEQRGSGCTPRGIHRVRLRIGANCPMGTVFRGRRPTGEIFSAELAAASAQRDWILTRILWLTGCELGKNRGGMVDTLRRYIYIHGCPESEPMGEPHSHGCIRMRNQNLVDLFNQTALGTVVVIR